MACFWKGILAALSSQMIHTTLNLDSKPSPANFVKILHEKAIKTTNISWNGKRLSSKELEENLEWIHNFKPNMVHNGYDCSMCDPYLLLICELFAVNIDHMFNGILIKYRYLPSTNVPLLKFGSSRTHFYVIKK